MIVGLYVGNKKFKVFVAKNGRLKHGRVFNIIGFLLIVTLPQTISFCDRSSFRYN
jgi:hypothetical protein